MSRRLLLPQPVGSGAAFAPRGHIDGLILSNDTDTDHDISVSEGEATLSDGSGNRIVAENTGAFVKQIDANWAAGTAAGGFPSGLTLSVDTWYHYFAISGSGGVMDFGFDTSLTAANLLADATSFSYFRRIGSVLTDGTSNIISFYHFIDRFFWSTPAIDVSDEPVGATTVQTATLSTPLGVECMAYVTTDGTGNIYIKPVVLDDHQVGDLAVISSSEMPKTNGINPATHVVFTNTSSQIHYRVANMTNDVEIMTMGWLDTR